MTLTSVVLLVIGLVLLVVGAEAFVRGASQLAALVGVSPLVIGLTVVAYGTSLPELAVSTISAYQGATDVAIGNVVGSNIANVLLILGLSALVAPLIVSQQLVRLDVPIMLGVSILVWFMGRDGNLSRLEGAVLFAGIIAYTAFLIIQSRKEEKAIKEEYAKEYGEVPEPTNANWLKIAGLIIGSLVMLVLGSNFLVDGAIAIAEAFNVSKLVIGLTIVAVGTSLPEMATSVVASYRGERDIAVGNVVGSNIFNILMVLGASALLTTDGLAFSPTVYAFDMPVAIGVALACLPIFFRGEIARWGGLLFLAYYIVYVVYLLMTASTEPNSSLPVFQQVVLYGALPLTAVLLIGTAVHSWRVKGDARWVK
ncbi:MAG: calcium/sodium antiporter [Chloroflexi bacterium]|nr:calcium/sodium antiporter [Chloroflexota bacterium]